MKIDVSEIKTMHSCKRQWLLSSRNRFHIRPTAPKAVFALGTLFHEALHQLYLGIDPDKVMAMVRKEMQTDADAVLLAMVPGYIKNVLPGDLERFKVLDIEHHFNLVPTFSNGEIASPDLEIVGSIDMIALDIEEGAIYGFEHKTAKSFRDPSYTWMDEQPRVYTVALTKYVDDYNTTHGTNYTVGGVYMNEVKKLLRDFKYCRTLCDYTEEDLSSFMDKFLHDCLECKHMVDTNDNAVPSPGYFTCQMCDYKTICQTYMYAPLKEDVILKEFEEEFIKREEDHLEEKVERTTE